MKNRFFESALERARSMIEDQQMISDLLDAAFVQLGNMSRGLYDIQDQFSATLRMLKAWVKREYTDISPKALIALLAAVIYFVNPLDLVSDFIPFIGWADDIAILTYVIKVCNKEIERFMAWEREQFVHDVHQKEYV